MKAIVIVFLTIGGYFAPKFVHVPATDSVYTDKPKEVFLKPFSFSEPNPVWFVRRWTVETDDIGNLLIDANLIKDATWFNLKLTNEEMILNGKKQKEEIHQQFLKRYMKTSNDKINITLNRVGGC